MAKEIKDLREKLFNQLERLSDPSCDLDKEMKRSTAMVEIGNIIVNSAKTEVDFIRVTKSKGTGFIPELPTGDDQKQLTNGN